MIDLEEKHLGTVRRILRRRLPRREIRAFGSRVTGRAGKFSDLDLVVMGRRRLAIRTLENLRDAFAESDLPITVEVLDWHALPDWLKTTVERQHEVVQQPATPPR